MNPVISVIIPAYNLEGLISNSLDSIIAQDYTNLEIVVVNDASKDNTFKVAQNVLAESGRKYKLINLDKNSGVSAARNKGIEEASGEFLLFFDGDDLCEKNMVSSLYRCATQTDIPADMTISGYKDFYKETEAIKKRPLKDIESLKQSTLQSLVADRILSRFTPANTALYKAEFIREKNVYYENGCIAGEDVEFMIKALSRAESVAISDDCPWIYVLHEKMGSNETNPEKKLRRYDSNTEAHIRTYRYIASIATEPYLIKINRYFQKPEAYFRQLSSAAMHGDREKFDSLRKGIKSSELLASVKVFFIKPEIFLKSISFILFPNRYYEHYKKRCMK